MKKLAVTGNIACGKNLVGSYLKELSCPVLDSDLIVHELLAEKNKITDKLVQITNPDSIVSENWKLDSNISYIDRKALGSLLFKDKILKKKVEAIVHPACFKMIDEFFAKEAAEGHKVAANLIPLLYETATEKNYDEVWLVVCNKELQLERLKHRNPELREEHLLERINSQLSQEEKLKKADFVIDNTGSRESTKEQVIIGWRKLINKIV
ncbi:MAG: dephospho-CoA kinase [Candidatus Caenarcaniphilales bacterium]|nr:dephospho-CoA kinase [Candidatus Caenarcaniphilales bacterium]